MDVAQALSSTCKEWDASIAECLNKYIEIPNVSPIFDPTYLTNGYQEQAVELLAAWVTAQNVPGLSMRIIDDVKDDVKGVIRTPLIFITIDGTDNTDETVLMYGHLDKQPPLTEHWDEGLHPYKPVLRDGKLYGRGGADDGYSIFAAVMSIKLLQEQKVPYSRVCIAIESSEESGSPDLPHYVEMLKSEIGTPSLVVCLDSGCGNYEQLWLTTSLRGIVVGNLKVKILQEGVHSGAGSGVIPDSFRIVRQLMDRIEDSKTGKLIDECYVEIPPRSVAYAKESAETMKDMLYKQFRFVDGAQPTTSDFQELALNKTWRPTLTVTGAGGLPTISSAGNVVRMETEVKLSIRLPPSLDPKVAIAGLTRELTRDAPYGAEVTWHVEKGSQGWTAPDLEPWLETVVQNSSNEVYGKPALFHGEGGSIPFMGMLARKFPTTQFVIIGVLGPSSNAHGPNEFLHVDMAQKLTVCVASIVAQHYQVRHKLKKQKK